MSSLTAAIIDDEPLARAAIRRLLEAERDVVVAGEAGDGKSALALVQNASPDVLFLDMDLPDMSGFDIVRQLPPGRRPAVIFVTAHSRFALQAFEVAALDYLLKPYTDERFYQALAKVRRELGQPKLADLATRLDGLLRQWPASPPDKAAEAGAAPDQLIVKSGTDLRVLKAEQVKWVQGQGDYLRIHSVTGNALVRETM